MFHESTPMKNTNGTVCVSLRKIKTQNQSLVSFRTFLNIGFYLFIKGTSQNQRQDRVKVFSCFLCQVLNNFFFEKCHSGRQREKEKTMASLMYYTC